MFVTFSKGNPVELHDYTHGFGRPTARTRGCQGETWIGREEEPVDYRKCTEQKTTQRNWRQNIGGV